MDRGTRRWVLAGAALAVVVIVTAGVLVLVSESSTGTAQRGGAGAGEVALDYLDAVARRDVRAAAALTDDPRAAESALSGALAGLGATAVRTVAEPPHGADGEREAARTFTITWTLGRDRVWTYDNTVTVLRGDEGWRVRWTPASLHPRLGEGQTLQLRTVDGTPAVLARDGERLLEWRSGEVEPAAGAGGPPMLLPALDRYATERLDPGWSVVRVGADGWDIDTLTSTPDRESGPLESTVSVPVQRAAQQAVDGVEGTALLVAIQPSSGDILAVAQNARAGAAPDALTGLYAPGSTFKIATATAVLTHGTASPETVLPCPATARIGTRTIPNDDRFDLGDVPLHTAFAHSCNTTFARLAADLPADALADAATRLGLNADFVIPGLTTEAGTVEPAADPVQRLEDGIGQGKVQASPFGVALMAATVAEGTPVTPRLWDEVDTTVRAGYDAPSGPVLDAVRAMMRQTVTSGTATALAPLGEVHGKTGTAQLPERTEAHGWFAGYRGDVAFAVLAQRAGSSQPAVAAATAFLRGLPA
ncbi:penicillin-binding transpeptidase domain-containing protein [Prauserella oleivorans]|uniref:Penicillin-binding transpeptidase domain-containing protein n=1 Tax=Prauserella oleivorans TaxID=1478153 RepID=A0ABW5WE73_9PSEU